MKQIPFSGPDITDKELEAVTEVIKSGWLAHGKYSKRSEELFCEYTGAKHVITVSNCTAGLHLSCLAAGFGAGEFPHGTSAAPVIGSTVNPAAR